MFPSVPFFDVGNGGFSDCESPCQGGNGFTAQKNLSDLCIIESSTAGSGSESGLSASGDIAFSGGKVVPPQAFPDQNDMSDRDCVGFGNALEGPCVLADRENVRFGEFPCAVTKTSSVVARDFSRVGSSDMRPSFATLDIGNSCDRAVEEQSVCLQRIDAGENGTDLFLGEFGASMIDASRASSGLIYVPRVVSGSAQEKVLDIEASGIVALVADDLSGWNISERIAPRQSVDAFVFLFDGYSRIGPKVSSTRPFDAARRLHERSAKYSPQDSIFNTSPLGMCIEQIAIDGDAFHYCGHGSDVSHDKEIAKDFRGLWVVDPITHHPLSVDME